MDVDGFVKLVDAQRNVATTRANVANTMADVATKIAKLGQIREEIIKARLENVAKFLDITWDAQAHRDLLRARNRARREARQLEAEAAETRRRAQRLVRLLAGHGSWTGIRDAWIAFEFFYSRISASAATEIGLIETPSDAYLASSWLHPRTHVENDVPEDERDLGSLLRWARSRTYYPRIGGAAWKVLSSCLQVMSEAASAQAEELQKRVEAAEEAATELAKEDWDRLAEG